MSSDEHTLTIAIHHHNIFVKVAISFVIIAKVAITLVIIASNHLCHNLYLWAISNIFFKAAIIFVAIVIVLIFI